MLDPHTQNGVAGEIEDPATASADLDAFVERLIPQAELQPGSIEVVPELPRFTEKLKACEAEWDMPFSQLSHAVQDAVVLRRLQQMIHTLRLNPHWKERIEQSGLKGAPRDFVEWQQLPISDRNTMSDLFMGARPGLVLPLSHGGFEIVASGGTSGGLPVETVYGLQELQDTYKVAGDFMGRYIFEPNLAGKEPQWVFTTLADYQMWSSGTMVGGVLQAVPDINYIGAGPIRREVFRHILSYPGPKAILGISQGIAILTDFALGIGNEARRSLRLALYGSGVLPYRKELELKEFYPNLEVLSYFAATQAEAIGLQLARESQLAAVPGLHLIEVVDEEGRWVADGEIGELVVTRLHAHKAPLPRLKLGDRMIRRPKLDGPGLRTQQFEFAGRSGDTIHLRDTQYSAPKVYDRICLGLAASGILDLRAQAHEIQFVNDRNTGKLRLIAAVDAAEILTARVWSILGVEGIRRVFIEALSSSLSLFNQGEANAEYLEKTQYSYELRLVSPWSAEIYRTELGKVPLIIDTLEAPSR